MRLIFAVVVCLIEQKSQDLTYVAYLLYMFQMHAVQCSQNNIYYFGCFS